MKKTVKIAAIAAILFAIGVYVFLQQQTVMRQVVVAAEPIPAGTVVTAEMVRTEAIPVTALLTGDLIADADAVVGKTVVAERMAGDIIPLAALADARKQPREGHGFIAVTVPLGGAAGARVGDAVSVAVFDHTGALRLLEGFVVVGVTNRERDLQLVLEADVSTVLALAPHLSTKTFAVVRR